MLPFYILLILYAIAILLYLFFVLICIYHLVHTASFTPLAIAVTLTVVIFGVLVISESIYLLKKIPEFSSSPLTQSIPTPVIDF